MADHAYTTPPTAANARARHKRPVGRREPPTDEGLKNTAHLALAAYQPDSDERLRAWLEYVADAAIAWLDTLDAPTTDLEAEEG